MGKGNGLRGASAALNTLQDFSSSATAFGADANTQTNPLDMALPGTLPVLNHAAVSQAIVFGLGVGAEIGKVSRFDRKNYFLSRSA